MGEYGQGSQSEMEEEIRRIICEEISNFHQKGINEERIYESVPTAEMKLSRTLEPDGWYTQQEIRDFLPDTISLNTKKGMVSKAVAAGKITTNNSTKREWRILGSSALEWLKTTGREEYAPATDFPRRSPVPLLG
ncbi:MAG TPA: hypothetical protein VN372_05360, partial [Methanospirillum sp.]|nr:hypothetical protein [Methanospirillum sp.]